MPRRRSLSRPSARARVSRSRPSCSARVSRPRPRQDRRSPGRVGPNRVGSDRAGRPPVGPAAGSGGPRRTDGPKNRDVTGRLIRRPACPISFAFHRRRTDSPTALPSSTRILANRRPDRSIIPVCDGGAGHHPDRRTDHGTTRRGHRGARLIRRTGPRADVRAHGKGSDALGAPDPPGASSWRSTLSSTVLRGGLPTIIGLLGGPVRRVQSWGGVR